MLVPVDRPGHYATKVRVQLARYNTAAAGTKCQAIQGTDYVLDWRLAAIVVELDM